MHSNMHCLYKAIIFSWYINIHIYIKLIGYLIITLNIIMVVIPTVIKCDVVQHITIMFITIKQLHFKQTYITNKIVHTSDT